MRNVVKVVGPETQLANYKLTKYSAPKEEQANTRLLPNCGNRTIPNGKFNAAKGTTFGQTATYVCNIGYTLFGDITVICTAIGWNSTNATCETTDCGDPTPKNAVANSTNYEYGSVIEITCNTGYSLTGESQMVCQDGGFWSASRPSCKPY
ncbi:membrane cofactor protein-like, partial [Mercenaria mercenaria]|uniref:membrane cofactor protein-like n=1 Tax=Mercenaria mercenaria TaxID=6596 RepID=UPI00234EF29B